MVSSFAQWEDKDCPVGVLHKALSQILHALLDSSSSSSTTLSVPKFSRWLRAITTIVLVRNTPDDRVKAVGYVEQAVEVMRDNDDVRYSFPSNDQILIGDQDISDGRKNVVDELGV